MFVELRHLRSLKTINETGNLSQAAARLHLTQSALSHQIKAVESYFGISLYLRKNKPLKLTPAGRHLLRLAEQLLPQVEATEYELKRMAGMEAGRLHITIECHSCFEWLIPTLDTYRQRWPDVEVDIRMGNNFAPLPSLIQGDVDLVISSDRIVNDALYFAPLFDFEALAIMPNDHILSQKHWLEPVDFADQVLITYPVATNRLDIFNHFLNPAKILPKEVRQSELTAMLLQLVASRRGIAVLPDWVLTEYLHANYVTARSLGESGLYGTVFAAIRKREASQAYLLDFIQLAQQAMLEKRTGSKA
ncbi:Transcriptional activator MetR [hydrothermal vent metagenome]|uniref:HTH-type transcriptional regulator MetR n=1 Tax=hydrothermal vent metagenome TaxID=652676 RepID=A0A3B1ADQ5_9ZZZZ